MNCTGVYIVGHFYNYGGYADMAHQYAMACAEAGIAAILVPTGEEKKEVKINWEKRVEESQGSDLGENPFAIILDIPPRFRMVEVSNVKKVIGSTIFETNSIPKEWVSFCGLVDEIWVPTTFNMNSFNFGGVHDSIIKKLPLAIDVNFWSNSGNSDAFKKNENDPVEFLCCGSLHRRKGLDRLVAAYFMEFSEKDNVRLTISCFPIKSGGLTEERINDGPSLQRYLNSIGMQISGKSKFHELPTLKCHYQYWNDEEFRNLFRQCDAYISTERANGWALPVMQMMALGKHTGTLDWGGSSEYCNDKNAYLIPAGDLEPVDVLLSNATAWYRGQAWPKIDTCDIKKCLRDIYDDIKNKKNEKGCCAKNLVSSQYSYSKMGERIKNLICYVNSKGKMPSASNIKVRESPYVSTHLHVVISKIRSLYAAAQEAIRISVFHPDTKELLSLLKIAGAQIVEIDGFSSFDKIIADFDKMNNTVLVMCEGVEKKLLATIRPLFKKIFWYDKQKMILVDVDKCSFQDGRSKLSGIFLSGGLKESVKKNIISRGLLDAPLFSFLPHQKHPVSWAGLKFCDIESVNVDDFCYIFIGDEDAYLRRISYQNAEVFFPNANIDYLCDNGTVNNLKPMTDQQIYQRSIPKRWSGASKGRIEKAVVLPKVTTKKQLAILLVRLSYFLSEKSDISIFLCVADELADIDKKTVSDMCREYCHVTYGDLAEPKWGHIKLVTEEKANLYISSLNYVSIIWSLKELTMHQRCALNLNDNILLFDMDYYSMRSGFACAYGEYYFKSKHDISILRNKSKSKLKRIAEKLENKTSVAIFGTGPSLATSFDMDFSDSITIACNTMVKDQKLIDHIKPDLIVASDADFHFGPSRYAQAFRKDLSRAIRKYRCCFVCPEAHAHLLLSHCPEIADYLIAIPVDGVVENFNLLKQFRVKAIDNVLLQFLLPIGATIGNEIKLVGFDGRKKDDAKFWGHNLDTQYSNLMCTIEASHPAFFFYRDYNDYFNRHCQLIEQYVHEIEKMKKAVCCLTHSTVPALDKRYQPPI